MADGAGRLVFDNDAYGGAGGMVFVPYESNLDFSGLTYAGQSIPVGVPGSGAGAIETYKDAAGKTYAWDYTNPNSWAYTIAPTPTTYDPNSLQTNYAGYKYFKTPSTDENTGQTYYIDPATNKPTLSTGWDNGPFYETQPKPAGGFDKFLTDNGWMIPLAMAGAGAGAALLGGEAAAGGLGAGMVDASGNIIGGGLEGAAYGGGLGTNAALQGPTYGELGITGVEGGFAGPTYAEMGYTGLNQADAIAAADAASKGLTGADALKYVNQARQVLGTGSQLAKLLGGTTGGTSGGTSGINPQQLASLLGGGQQTNSFIGQIKANQNPFTFTSAGQTAATPGMYDVSGSNLANALRKA